MDKGSGRLDPETQVKSGKGQILWRSKIVTPNGEAGPLDEEEGEDEGGQGGFKVTVRGGGTTGRPGRDGRPPAAPTGARQDGQGPRTG